MKIPVEHSAVVADLYSIGFKLHHAKQNYIMMKKWLPVDEEDKMPLYAFHTVGVSGKDCFRLWADVLKVLYWFS